MLPYKTIGEAEAVLNRSLTFAETLWFKYSANKSDFFLYYHSILFLFIIISLAPLQVVFLELLRPYNLDRFKLQPKVKLSRSEIFACCKAVMKIFFLAIVPLQLVSYPTIKFVGIWTGLPLPSIWEILTQLIVYFLVEDYMNYWIHRWLHSEWGYEKIHKVHHEYSAPTAFTASYAHWAEILILGLPTFLGPAMVPGHMITLWLWGALRHIEAMEIHSGYDFPWNPTKYIPFYGGAEHHDYHHFVGRQSHSNFASVFTYCDYIYGTDKGFRRHKKLLAESGYRAKSNGGLYDVPSQNIKAD